MLRNSLLVSSLLCNSEAWYNVSKVELDYLESVDLMLLRKLLQAPKSTPKEMLHMELGCLPLREIIRKRRLSFLFYILNQDPQSLVFRFFETQLKNRTEKDWVTEVLKDLKELGWNVNFEEIKQMRKTAFIRILKQRIEAKALKDLEISKSSHSKVKHLKHEKLKMQSYFLPNMMKMSREDMQLIFKLRCRVTDLKTNLKGIYDSYECKLCENEEETQEHILKCKEIINEDNEVNYEEKFTGTVKQKWKIAKCFKENMKIRDNLIKAKDG